MVFSIPSILGPAEEKRITRQNRVSVAPFLTSRGKKGHNPDALFDKEVRILGSGVDVQPAADTPTENTSKSKSTLENKPPFIGTSRTKRAEGLGSYYGTFDGKPPVHLPNQQGLSRGGAAASSKLDESGAASPPHTIRPIYTSPGKAGSYGTPNLALSKIGEDYIASYYDQPQRNSKTEREELAKKLPPVAFKPAGRKGATFDEAVSTGASQVYSMTKPFTEKPKPKEEKHFVINEPWKPAGVAATDGSAAEYMEDPYDGTDPRDGPNRTKKYPSDKFFVPSVRGDDFWYSSSIVFRGL